MHKKALLLGKQITLINKLADASFWWKGKEVKGRVTKVKHRRSTVRQPSREPFHYISPATIGNRTNILPERAHFLRGRTIQMRLIS